MSGFSGLNAAEDERLALLCEELGEAVQAICKIQRHGYESFDPTLAVHKRKTNRLKLEEELGDVLFAIKLMVGNGDLIQSNLDAARKRKAETINKWLHHNSSFFAVKDPALPDREEK